MIAALLDSGLLSLIAPRLAAQFSFCLRCLDLSLNSQTKLAYLHSSTKQLSPEGMLIVHAVQAFLLARRLLFYVNERHDGTDSD